MPIFLPCRHANDLNYISSSICSSICSTNIQTESRRKKSLLLYLPACPTDSFDANDLNKVLRNIMEGLSVKVFRTYNASIHFERMLREQVRALYWQAAMFDES